jgi:N6-adenosine-specific RNA methylase IME4
VVKTASGLSPGALAKAASNGSLAHREALTPERLDAFREYLATTSDLGEIRKLQRGMDAYRRFSTKREEQRLAAIGAIWAAFRGGEVRADTNKPRGGRGKTSDRLSEDFPDLSRDAAQKLSERWQQLYAKGQEAIEEYLKEADWPTYSGAASAHGGKPAAMPEFPTGVYPVIYADPPWRYEGSLSQSREIEANYATLDLVDLLGLDVQALAADPAILFLWATSPKLPDALTLMDGWGFDYTTCAVWVKDKIGPGYTFRQRHELLLVGKRGSMPTPGQSDRPGSVIEAPRTKHSQKPTVVYELIERMYPGVAKLELFARTERDGWASWGNEVA